MKRKEGFLRRLSNSVNCYNLNSYRILTQRLKYFLKNQLNSYVYKPCIFLSERKQSCEVVWTS